MLHVLVLFGGRSSEHDVSIMSCKNVVSALDTQKYDIEKVFITKDGQWKYVDGPIEEFDEETVISSAPAVHLLVGAKKPTLGVRNGEGFDEKPVDIAIPVLHGHNGEDGTIQGLFEMAQLPYVGSGVLGSAVGMDKITTKRVVLQSDIAQAAYDVVYTYEFDHIDEVMDRIETKLGYPVYVKPANAGSSVGVSRAADRKELKTALEVAAKEDSRILIEEEIIGREVECAVMGNVDHVEASGVGEILAADEFYTYDAKYNNQESKTVLDPDLPKETIEEIRKDAVTIFRMINGGGLSRVDFFVEKKTGKVIFNEINTLPGFTKISMWPMLWKAAGMEPKQQLDRLIELGLER